VSVVSMAAMFHNASAFNQDINSVNNNASVWNTTAVTDMNYMFKGATAFNGDISAWTTSSVTNMSYMFSGATSFNQDIGNWDTSNVVTMEETFSGASSFNQPLKQNGNAWNLANVTNMGAMFQNANLSIANYDIFLFSQANNPNINSDILIEVSSEYTDTTSRNFLTGTKNWTITDNGLGVDIISPTVTNITSTKADGTYRAGEVIPINVAFSEVVNVTGTPTLILETGDNDAVVNYSLGTGTNTLTFNYTLATGHSSNDLDYVAINSFSLNNDMFFEIVSSVRYTF